MLHLGQASRPAAFYRMETIPSLRPHSAMHMHLYIERWRDRERSIIKYHRSIIFRRGGRGGREQRQITRWLLWQPKRPHSRHVISPQMVRSPDYY
jgi:hypothetical protein